MPMRIAIMLAAALAACAPQAEPPVPDDSPAPIAQRSAPYDLTGTWTISRIDGQSLAQRIAFSGSEAALTWQPTCAGQGISYRTIGTRIEFYQPPREGPREVCDIGYPDDLPRVIQALQGMWAVAERQGGNVVLRNGTRQMELEKTPPAPQVDLAGEWRVAGIDGNEFDEPYGIALSADGEEIWWEPRCAGAIVQYRIVNERFVVIEPPPVSPTHPASDRTGMPMPPPPAVCTIGLPPRLPDVMNAIRAAEKIERTPANAIRLSGNGRSLTLFGQ